MAGASPARFTREPCGHDGYHWHDLLRAFGFGIGVCIQIHLFNYPVPDVRLAQKPPVIAARAAGSVWVISGPRKHLFSCFDRMCVVLVEVWFRSVFFPRTGYDLENSLSDILGWVFLVWAFCCHMWALHELHNIPNVMKSFQR